MIAPGTYAVVGEARCWSRFTLYPDGRVEFIDAIDGHRSYWGTKSTKGAAWLADVEEQLGRGELRKEGP
ncbi:MAG TPA: hypothetical protein VLE97_11250 [Gaiellaceae bacterium]|nr:hypothetical protein [Gaiellaceae bacterium]